MNGVVAGTITVAVLLAAILVVAVVVRRKRARRVPDRDEILRRARAASRQIARDKPRGTMKRGGLGEGTEPNRDAALGSDTSGGSAW